MNTILTKLQNTDTLTKSDFNRFIAMLEKRFAEPDLTVNDISKSIGMSRFTLFRKLRTTVDMTPCAFIRQYRLQKAAHMLLDRVDSVTDIAYSVGFNDVRYFSKCFKEEYKLTPSQYIWEK